MVFTSRTKNQIKYGHTMSRVRTTDNTAYEYIHHVPCGFVLIMCLHGMSTVYFDYEDRILLPIVLFEPIIALV